MVPRLLRLRSLILPIGLFALLAVVLIIVEPTALWRSQAIPASCGNGTIDVGETCMEPGLGTCPASQECLQCRCQAPNTNFRCGNTYGRTGGCTRAGQLCIVGCLSGNRILTGRCDAQMNCYGYCGDGKVDSGEQCDTGNSSENSDGCTEGCSIREGWTCTGSPSHCTLTATAASASAAAASLALANRADIVLDNSDRGFMSYLGSWSTSTAGHMGSQHVHASGPQDWNRPLEWGGWSVTRVPEGDYSMYATWEPSSGFSRQVTLEIDRSFGLLSTPTEDARYTRATINQQSSPTPSWTCNGRKWQYFGNLNITKDYSYLGVFLYAENGAPRNAQFAIDAVMFVPSSRQPTCGTSVIASSSSFAGVLPTHRDCQGPNGTMISVPLNVPCPTYSASSPSAGGDLYSDIIYTGDVIPQPKLKLKIEGPTYGPVDTPYTLTAVVENTGDLFDKATEFTVSWIMSGPEVLSYPPTCKRSYPSGGISGYPVYFTCPVPAITPATPGRQLSFPFTFRLNRSKFTGRNTCVDPTSMIFELKPIIIRQRTPVGNIINHQIGRQKVPLLFTHKCPSSSSSRPLAACGNGIREGNEQCEVGVACPPINCFVAPCPQQTCNFQNCSCSLPSCPSSPPPACHDGVLFPQIGKDANGCSLPPVCCQGAARGGQCTTYMSCMSGRCIVDACTCANAPAAPIEPQPEPGPSPEDSATLHPDIIYPGDTIPQPALTLKVEGPTYGPVDTPYTLTAVVENTGDLFDKATEFTVSWIMSGPEVLSYPPTCKRSYPSGGISGYPVYFTCPVPAITPATPGRKFSFPFTFRINRSKFSTSKSCIDPTSMIFELKPIFIRQRTPVGNIINHQIGWQKVPLLFTHQCVSSSSSRPLAVCGNGIMEQPEWCDDGNSASGDGCYKCLTQGGFSCTKVYGQKSVCTRTLCGNGKVDTGEQCDDANVVGNDGCGGDCKVESGFSCAVFKDRPSSCSRGTCGNGRWDLYEDCDDGNKNSGDGCSAACKYEAGWVCNKTPNPDVCTRGTSVPVPKIITY